MSKEVFPFRSSYAPALPVFNDTFFIAWTDPAGSLQMASEA
jgi:hypothetical protein